MELLSPAGNFEALKTAVACGANAVYLGGKQFGARRNAANFTNEALREAVDFCHLRGVSVYVTLNIMLKESEIKEAYAFAAFLAEIGVDGVIVQDLGLLCALSEISPDLKRNVSTQMTVCSSFGANLLKTLGANRVVLARELSQSEIASIRNHTDVELEVFVHGAMCMSWSGQCLLSSLIGARSGNRGLCAQPCRLPYRLFKDGKPVTEEKPLLCMKDLCLAEEINALASISDSAKIEGRMKSAEYTGGVTKVYKSALDGTVTQKEIKDMLAFFSRGGSEKGYFNGRSFAKMMAYQTAEKVSATKEQLSEIHKTDVSHKRNISFHLTAKTGEPVTLSASCDGFTVLTAGTVAEEAKNGRFDEERMKQQLAKLGETPFVSERITIEAENNPFVSVSALNGLRRKACAELETKICASYRRTPAPYIWRTTEAPKAPKKPKICVQVRTKEQYLAAKALGVSAMYLSYGLYKEVGTPKDVCVLPPVTKEGESIEAEKNALVMVQNMGQILPMEHNVCLGGERLNVANSETIFVLKKLGFRRVTLSVELNLKELRQVIKNSPLPTEVIVYGRTPVMLLENCVIKSCGACAKGKDGFALMDRRGEMFPLICEESRNVMLNSVPLYMADKLSDVLSLNADALRLVFTTEDGETTKKVLQAYLKAQKGIVPKSVFSKITRGHFYRGVE